MTRPRLESPRSIFGLALVVMLAGCDNPAFVEYEYAGTQLAVEACITRNTSPLVAPDVIKDSCIKKHQKNINTIVLNGSTLALNTEFNTLTLDATVSNKSTDEIITGIVVTVTMPVQGKPNFTFEGTLIHLWIYPGQRGQGYVSPTSDDNGAVLARAMELLKAGSKWSWTISAATAVGFRLKA